MYIGKKYCFWLFMGLAVNLFSQNPVPAIERITVFGEYHPPVSAPPVQTTETEESIRPAWILKFSPTLLSRGELPVFIERRISSRCGIEVAAGITFQDFLKQTFFPNQPVLQANQIEEKLSGIVAKLSFHYYLGKSAPSELYCAPQIEFKNYRKDVHGVYFENGRYAAGKVRDQQTYMDIKAMLGYQPTEEFERDFFFDWFIGAGLRLGSEDNVIADERNSNIIKLHHVNVLRPVITAGVKLSLGL